MLRTLLLLLVIIPTLALSEARIRPNNWSSPVIGTKLDNLYKVDKDIYRSEQPSHKDFKQLEKFGISEVLNLREYNSDNEEAEDTKLVLHRLKLETDSVTEEELIHALSIIQKRKGPILVHCWHGADRTGTTIAAYRIIFNQWSKEQALDEMINGGYGYHSRTFPNLVELIKNLDIKKIRSKLGLIDL